MAYCYFGLIFCGIFQYLPIILDVILPLNDSRPCQLFVVTEYFVNQEKYFYVLLLHEVLAYIIGTITLCGTSATIMICIVHACALFKIASCRIENAIKKSTLIIPSPRKEYFFYRRTVHAVVMHQRATKFVELLTSSFAILFFILIIVGVSSFSLNLFQFLQLITFTKNISQAFIVAIWIFFHLNYMFIANYGGQELLNHGLKLFKATKTLALLERNYKIYRIILKTLGLWPYEQTYLTWLHKVLFISIFLTFLLAQLYIEQLKILLEQIQNDWNSLQDKLETDIIEKYACNMRLFAIAMMVYCQISLFLCGLFELFPLILNVVLPLNESRPFHLIALTEYFVNQEKYIRYLLLHEMLIGYIAMYTLWGICVILVMYMMHACALFKIASFRIENAVEKNILMVPSPKRECLLFQKIIQAVVMHRRAIESVPLYFYYIIFCKLFPQYILFFESFYALKINN
ncbi:hypothetical protein ALC62_03633 [Cyphomyrmex costatus]|uniref:Odorant receptor n=1 Tax=Cyphomyrmex costatus TaxID=456900 RepID=A0A195CXF9_9HYME|nr:hypothetical protein ALC62_03633 [Cyphomyrmex costatus]